MFKSILVPIDLADTDLAKPAIATAATLSQTWNGSVRLLNVLPMTPVMLAEYVPADFDAQQRADLGRSARDRGAGIRHRGVAHFHRGAAGRHLSRDPRRGRGDQGRPDRDDLAPAGDADLFPRLQCRPCGALRQMLGAGGAALSDRDGARSHGRIDRAGHAAATAAARDSGSAIAAAPPPRSGCASIPMSRSARSSSSLQRFDGCAALQIGRRARRHQLPSRRKNPPDRLRDAGWAAAREIVVIFLLQLAFARQSAAAGANACDSACALLASDCLHSPQCNRGLDGL